MQSGSCIRSGLAAFALFAAPFVARAGEVLPSPASGSRETVAERLAPPPIETVPARRLAQRWLSQPRCQEMFRKFQDSSGQTLQAVLSARGETAESYISRIAFLQGFEAGRCGENGVVAMTTLGTPVVWLCGRKFAAVARRDLSTGAVVLLHEELHTLGLGEDPPTSQEISRLVETSCR